MLLGIRTPNLLIRRRVIIISAALWLSLTVAFWQIRLTLRLATVDPARLERAREFAGVSSVSEVLERGLANRCVSAGRALYDSILDRLTAQIVCCLRLRRRELSPFLNVLTLDPIS
jgi:hypothetical protein